jgi:hypothetical protein
MRKLTGIALAPEESGLTPMCSDALAIAAPAIRGIAGCGCRTARDCERGSRPFPTERKVLDSTRLLHTHRRLCITKPCATPDCGCNYCSELILIDRPTIAIGEEVFGCGKRTSHNRTEKYGAAHMEVIRKTSLGRAAESGVLRPAIIQGKRSFGHADVDLKLDTLVYQSKTRQAVFCGITVHNAIKRIAWGCWDGLVVRHSCWPSRQRAAHLAGITANSRKRLGADAVFFGRSTARSPVADYNRPIIW